jgi:hypothetical protein
MKIADNLSLAYKESKGLSKCFDFYADYFSGEEIMEVGFNENSGYVYIALEFDSIAIASLLGGDVEIIYTDLETGEEVFFESFDEYEKTIMSEYKL